jgi:hypothetical protein
MDRLLCIEEAAEFLRVKPATLYVWKRRGVGPPAIKLPSGAIRFRRDTLEKWLVGLERAPRRTGRVRAIADE